jgi:hypothetical protein
MSSRQSALRRIAETHMELSGADSAVPYDLSREFNSYVFTDAVQREVLPKSTCVVM